MMPPLGINIFERHLWIVAQANILVSSSFDKK
jgi:hypothetical protein